MRTKNLCLLISIFFLILAQFSGASDGSALRIYLPREAQVHSDIIKLGNVSIIRGEDSLVAKANEIALGKLSDDIIICYYPLFVFRY